MSTEKTMGNSLSWSWVLQILFQLNKSGLNSVRINLTYLSCSCLFVSSLKLSALPWSCLCRCFVITKLLPFILLFSFNCLPFSVFFTLNQLKISAWCISKQNKNTEKKATYTEKHMFVYHENIKLEKIKCNKIIQKEYIITGSFLLR